MGIWRHIRSVQMSKNRPTLLGSSLHLHYVHNVVLLKEQYMKVRSSYFRTSGLAAHSLPTATTILGLLNATAAWQLTYVEKNI